MNERERVEFTREMKRDYTILIPGMLPIHFELISNLFRLYGYNTVLLRNEGRRVVDTGLKYVHNDTCYPALLCIGQLIDALESGAYDLHKVALMITQTGGGCRASNYIFLLRKALKKAGMAHIPVISLNISKNLEKNSGFQITLPLLFKCLCMLVYGDLIMLLFNQTRPYETHPGDAKRLSDAWTKRLTEQMRREGLSSVTHIQENMAHIVEDFDAIDVVHLDKIKVGVVGEIYVKYAALANNHLEDFLFEQDCETMVPGVMGFMAFKCDNRLEDVKLYGGNPLKKVAYQFVLRYIDRLERRMRRAIAHSRRFHPPMSYKQIKAGMRGVMGYGCRMGEGWLLTGEMLELVKSGYPNIVCAQPFGCLPNHIVGKGMIRRVKQIDPDANIVAVDYDPGATRVNQENRIRLMLAVARERGAASRKERA